MLLNSVIALVVGSAADESGAPPTIEEWYFWPIIAVIAVPLATSITQIVLFGLQQKRRPSDTKIALDALRDTNADLRLHARTLRDVIKQLTQWVTTVSAQLVQAPQPSRVDDEGGRNL